MDAVTILSAAAAASQFVEYGLEIIAFVSTLYSKIRDAPDLIRKRSSQLHSLIDIAKQVKDMPPLQTNTAADILSRCIGESDELLAILQKISAAAGDGIVKKAWKAAVGVAQEKKILDLLADLEQQKTLLMLHIEAGNS